MSQRTPQKSFKEEEGSPPQTLPQSLPTTGDLSAADLAILNDEAKQTEFRLQFALQIAHDHKTHVRNGWATVSTGPLQH